MYLERLQVEEGFLSGLDAKFTPGLNVVIGARGTGKTSLIELIRFCLDVGGSTADINKRSREHALSILGSGQVTATIVSNEQRTSISRTGLDIPAPPLGYLKPIVFSQTEIETVGLESSGRLRLIDGFIPYKYSDETEEKQIISTIASLTTESAALRRELDELTVLLNEKTALNEELALIQQQEARVASSSTVLQEKTHSLKQLTNAISLNAVNEANIQRAQADVYNWYIKIKEALDFSITGGNEVNQILGIYESQMARIKEGLNTSHTEVSLLWNHLENSKKAANANKLSGESQARELRQELEALQAGAGQVMRKGQEIRSRIAQIESIQNVFNSKIDALSKIIEKRKDAFDRLEGKRHDRFSARENVINDLNNALAPNIKIGITRNGQPTRYASLIADLLRGSSIKYNDIAPAIASSVSPRVFLESIESFDASLIAESANISMERAARVLTHLKQSDIGSLATIDLEDEVTMQLLDGADYKDISALSTGQRCTVILPIVLAHKDRLVIVDQPEDHIDNAFITSTLIKAVINRTPNSQIIFSTHNPNIPVLGDADNVIHMGSDGKRGFILAKGNLNDNPVVAAISTVMEGGADAFLRRAEFYRQNDA